jgi:hypothetical protein
VAIRAMHGLWLPDLAGEPVGLEIGTGLFEVGSRHSRRA